jgi:hypothetical protein
MKINSTDVLALVLIVGGLILKGFGVDGVIDSILIAIASLYFGHKIAQK